MGFPTIHKSKCVCIKGFLVSAPSPSSDAPAATPAAWRLSSNAAFALLAAVLFAFFLAAAAPSPLFVLFQQDWGFSSALLTVAFAVYALALLASLLVAGALSDHVGRRPVIVVALVLQAVAMVMFLVARGIGGIVAARVVQGLATGIASGTLSAAVLEAAPASRKRLGTLITSTSPLAGLAVGAAATGLTVSLSSHPVPLIFGTLTVLLALGAVAAYFIPETATPRPGAWASLVPRVSVAQRARGEFARGLPVLVSSWALAGLFLSLVPSILRHIFAIDSGVTNGLAIATLFGVGAVSPSLMRPFGTWTPVAGMLSTALGVALLLAAFASGSVLLFFVGAAVAGLGFGASFAALLQALAPLAQVHERAELFAALFVVSYLAFSVPAMGAGLLIASLGLRATVEGYAVLVIAMALVGAWAQWRGRARTR